LYPVLFLDALRVNIRDEGHVSKKSVYLAPALRMDGQKELLGMWIEGDEGAEFWAGVLNELKNRGIRDVLIAAVDGLAGFPEAVNAVCPGTDVRLSKVRNSVKYVSYKDRKAVTADLKEIYPAPSADAVQGALDRFAGKRDAEYPAVSKSRRNGRNEVIPFMKFSPEIRRAVYTADAVESVK
jgi:transposase-like protein